VPQFEQLTRGTLGYNTDWNNVAPTIGVAWRPNVQRGWLRTLLGDPEQATLRGGYAVAYERQGMAVFTGVFGPNPGSTLSLTRSLSTGIIGPGESWPVLLREPNRLYNAPFPETPTFPIAIRPNRADSINAFHPDIEISSARTWTVGFQRALSRDMAMEIRYVGTRGVKFNLYRNFNDVDRVTGLRPNPNDITGPYLDNSGQSNYNSWQTSLRQHMTRGLLFNLHHTWGKALSYNGGDVAPGHIGDSRGDVQDFALVKLERALSTGDIMHYVAADWVYEVPGLFRNSRAAQRVLGGWQFSGIFRANSGPALGVTQTGGRPDILDIKNQVNKECCGFGRLQYLNPAAYRLVPVSSASSRTVRRGEANATPVRGPGNWNVDFSLGKNFPITEGKTLELKADLQNALNHTQYINVSTNLSGINFGQVNGTRTARVVQLQLRFAF